MDRASSRRGPREDDKRKQEEQGMLRGEPDEGRSEPRRGESPGPGEAGRGMREEMTERQGSAPSQETIEARAALATCFSPSSFPAGRDRLVAEAEARYADEDLIQELRALPDGTYDSVGEIWRALGWDD